jgi:hypothetical protein
MFVAVMPVGARALGLEGRSDSKYVHRTESHPEYLLAWKALQENRLDPALPATECLVLMRKLAELLRKARRGLVTTGGKYPELRVIESSSFIYELRPPENRSALRRPERAVRIYCAEPRPVTNLILLLHMATKPGTSADTRGEQQAAIREAETRGNRWEWDRIHEKTTDG